MTRKIIQIGDSIGVTIPKSIREKFNLAVGEEVEITEDEDKIMLRKVQNDAVDPELASWTDEFIDEYRGALEALADK